MFTGLIEEVGAVREITHSDGGGVITIDCAVVVEDVVIGDSIAVNGVCLTVTRLPEPPAACGAGATTAQGSTFSAEMMGETLARTALADLDVGSPVNLERAMRAGGRLGGHMVQGHVDGVGTILAIQPHEEWTTVTYELPGDLSPFVVEKGSITIDGTSLTVTAVGRVPATPQEPTTFSVGLIPHTLGATTHGDRRVGDHVNLEVDVIAKYVQRQIEAHMATFRVAGGREDQP